VTDLVERLQALHEYLAESTDASVSWCPTVYHAVQTIERQNDLIESLTNAACSGGPLCRSPRHVHGCLRDRGDCNEPKEHHV
jgi:hypothetical protein